MRRLLASTVVNVGLATGVDESQAPAGCAFHYGHSDAPCCGQEGTGVAPSDPHVCPATLPTCTDYVYNHHYGWCANAASGTAFCASCLAAVLEGTDCACIPHSSACLRAANPHQCHQAQAHGCAVCPCTDVIKREETIWLTAALTDASAKMPTAGASGRSRASAVPSTGSAAALSALLRLGACSG